jgi:osmoprotectant transport system substrate-binding protein
MFPPDEMTPFVTEKVVKEHPSIVKWLDKLSAALTNNNFANLDAQAYAGAQPQAVAQKFLKKHGLL